MNAALTDTKDVIEKLLENDADPNIKGGRDDLSPLLLTSDKGIVQLLIDHGAKLDIKDKYGWTPLMYASFQGNSDLVKFYIDSGIDPNIQDTTYKNTALMLASGLEHFEVVKLLLEHGADPNIKGIDDITALSAAAATGNNDIVKILLKHDATHTLNVVETPTGNTALILASMNGYNEIVKLLLEHGADPTIKNKEGKTALDLAANDEIKKLIEDKLKRVPKEVKKPTPTPVVKPVPKKPKLVSKKTKFLEQLKQMREKSKGLLKKLAERKRIKKRRKK